MIKDKDFFIKKWYLCLLIGLYTITPLIFNNYGNWIFELPKSRVLYIIIALITLTVVWARKVLVINKLVVIGFIYLLGLFFLGVANADDPMRAFFGSYERQFGFLGYFFVISFKPINICVDYLI